MWKNKKLASSLGSIIMVLMTLHTYPYALLGVSLFLSPMAWSPPGSSVHGGSPGYNTGAGCHAFLQDMYVYTHILSPLYISLEKETATHSSHSTRYAPQTAWRATDHGGHKESDTMEHAHFIYGYASKTRDLKHKTYIIQGGKSERN